MVADFADFTCIGDAGGVDRGEDREFWWPGSRRAALSGIGDQGASGIVLYVAHQENVISTDVYGCLETARNV